jgi:hypothetical protein
MKRSCDELPRRWEPPEAEAQLKERLIDLQELRVRQYVWMRHFGLSPVAKRIRYTEKGTWDHFDVHLPLAPYLLLSNRRKVLYPLHPPGSLHAWSNLITGTQQ